MLINKPFTLMLIFIAIALIMASSTAFGNYYIGFYRVINWPVISISIINGTSTENGVVIVISPSTQVTQQYEVFSGIGLLGNEYLVVDGIIYSNGTIYVISTTPINATVSAISNSTSAVASANAVYGGIENVVRGEHVYRAGQPIISPIINPRIPVGRVSVGRVNNALRGVHGPGGAGGAGSVMIIRDLLYVSMLTTASLIALLTAAPFIRLYVGSDRECVDREFVRLVRKLGLRDPSLTHRDVGDYLRSRFHVNEYLVDRLVSYYEMAIYGNANVGCGEFKEIIRQVINEWGRRG